MSERSIFRMPLGVALVVGLLIAAPLPVHAQQCQPEFFGAWTGTLPAADGMLLHLAVTEEPDGRFTATIESTDDTETVRVRHEGNHLRFQSASFPVAFDGVVSVDGTALGGFVQYAAHVTRLDLRVGDRASTWEASWTPLGIAMDSLRLDLYIEDDGEGGVGGYFFFRDPRLTALWGYGLECGDGTLVLREKNLDLRFEGRYDPGRDFLDLSMTGSAGPTQMTFARMPEDEASSSPDAPEIPARTGGETVYEPAAPLQLDDGWPSAAPGASGIDPGPISDMVRAVVEGELAYTHSVLIARHGRLVVEEYFYGFDRETLHDMRSASKTITSTLVGLAVQDGRIQGSTARALPFFPNYRRYDNWDDRKADIRIRDLLTMSSGLDANDSDYASAASEGRYQSQTARPDWIKLALDAPMIADPGSQPLYGGANPLILGGILANVSDETVEWFAHRTLFEPLGIESYRFFLDPTGVVYMGGGLWMRPRDMAKVGQMYLDGGLWKGRRVLDEAWIEESWGRYGRLAPLDRNGHQYGYLWWHHRYEVDGRTIETLEARGNGGQYIFVAPSLDLVGVITSGNFRNRKTREPESIFERFVLPAVLAADAGSGAG